MNAATQPARQKQPVQSFEKRDQLILDHLSLVSGIASHVQKTLPVHVDHDDLVHAGTMGLFEAATKYREEKEVSFVTYAKHRIRRAILDYLRQIDWASRDLRKRHRQLESVRQSLKTALQRDPSDAEISEAMGLSRKQWQCFQVDLNVLNAVSAPIRAIDEDERPLQDPPGPASHAPDKVFERRQLRSHLQSALRRLPPRQQEVMHLYYQGEYTMREIGGMLGVNESRVSQIHRAALGRLQATLEETGIRSAAAF